MAVKHPSITLEYILLGLLMEGPAHGYALYDKVQNTSELSLIWQVKRSKLYYLLDKLAGEGLLTHAMRAVEGVPDRKTYQITAEGKGAFEKWRSSPVLSSRYVRIAFLSKLYFALARGRDRALALIDAQRVVCQAWHENLEEEQRKVEAGDFISKQVYLFRIGQISATLSWLDNCRNQIPD